MCLALHPCLGHPEQSTSSRVIREAKGGEKLLPEFSREGFSYFADPELASTKNP
jgi:hypothetical protein